MAKDLKRVVDDDPIASFYVVSSLDDVRRELRRSMRYCDAPVWGSGRVVEGGRFVRDLPLLDELMSIENEVADLQARLMETALFHDETFPPGWGAPPPGCTATIVAVRSALDGQIWFSGDFEAMDDECAHVASDGPYCAGCPWDGSD